MILPIPDPSLVLLMGPTGAGKSSFARKHFRPTEVLSSDFFRGMVSGDETDQTASADAFEVLHLLAEKRLARGLLTVIDATNVQHTARLPLLRLARRYHLWAVAVVLNLPAELCHARNQQRPDRAFGPKVVQSHAEQLRRSLDRLWDEGFHAVHVLSTVEEIDAAEVRREPLPVNRAHDHGPFDIIGDVHGCLEELKLLLAKLGYAPEPVTDRDGRPTVRVTPPPGRKAVFLGDLVDRGPDSAGVLRLVMGMAEAGQALCVPGNHDAKLLKKLEGREVSVPGPLAETLRQLGAEPPGFAERVRAFLGGLVSHYVLDGGRLVVVHAGLKEHLQGRVSKWVRDFALYGETTGGVDEYGLPVRLDWARDYRGRAKVVYGHIPVAEPAWRHNTICTDTGCAFGGALTALRYPELALVSVPPARVYCAPNKPLPKPGEARGERGV